MGEEEWIGCDNLWVCCLTISIQNWRCIHYILLWCSWRWKRKKNIQKNKVWTIMNEKQMKTMDEHRTRQIIKSRDYIKEYFWENKYSINDICTIENTAVNIGILHYVSCLAKAIRGHTISPLNNTSRAATVFISFFKMSTPHAELCNKGKWLQHHRTSGHKLGQPQQAIISTVIMVL